MSNSVVIGMGWHPGLFRQEATQLIESFEFVHAHALVCDTSDAHRLISQSSLISEVLSPGGIVSVDNIIETVAEAFLLTRARQLRATPQRPALRLPTGSKGPPGG